MLRCRGGLVVKQYTREPDFGPHMDLKSVRETLEYIYGDIRQEARLTKLAVALDSAIKEIDAVGVPRRHAVIERLASLPGGRLLR